MASKKQLHELLKENQEPFFLGVCSQKNACSNNRGGVAIALLRSMVSKMLRGKPLINKALNLDGNMVESGRWSFRRFFSEMGIRTDDGDHQWRRSMEMEESKQLSPVSVLKFNNHVCSEENRSSTSGFASARETEERVFDHHEKQKKNFSLKGLQDVESLRKLLTLEMLLELRNGWSHLDVGVEMEAAIFEEIVDEIVLEVVGIHCT